MPGKKKNGEGDPPDMTIRELASVLSERLDGVTERLDGVTERLDGVTERLDGVTGKLDGVAGRLDSLETTVASGFAHLTEKIDALSAGAAGVGRMTRLEERVLELEKRLGVTPSP